MAHYLPQRLSKLPMYSLLTTNSAHTSERVKQVIVLWISDSPSHHLVQSVKKE